MAKTRKQMFGVAAAVVIGGGGIAWPLLRRHDPTDLSYSDGWLPTPAQIAARVGTANSAPEARREALFAELFKLRYRKHDQAIGLKFRDGHRLRVLFAPTLSRWQMAKVAVAAARETRTVFGRDLKVEICETYISAPQRKVGEVHLDARGHAAVRFDPEFEVEELRVSSHKQQPGEVSDSHKSAPNSLSGLPAVHGAAPRPSGHAASPAL